MKTGSVARFSDRSQLAKTLPFGRVFLVFGGVLTLVCNGYVSIRASRATAWLEGAWRRLRLRQAAGKPRAHEVFGARGLTPHEENGRAASAVRPFG